MFPTLLLRREGNPICCTLYTERPISLRVFDYFFYFPTWTPTPVAGLASMRSTQALNSYCKPYSASIARFTCLDRRPGIEIVNTGELVSSDPRDRYTIETLSTSNVIERSPDDCFSVRDGVFPFTGPGKVVTIFQAYLQNTVKALGLINESCEARKWAQHLNQSRCIPTFLGVRNVLRCSFAEMIGCWRGSQISIFIGGSL